MGPNVRSSLIHFAQGLLMGGADIIPGVSGGTMALIVGIYARLIDSLSSLFSVALATLRFDREAFRRHVREVEWRLILPLGFGIATAIYLASQFIPYLIETYPEQMLGLFFGLVAASLAIPWLRIDDPGGREIAVALPAALLAFLFVGLPQEGALQPGLLRVFASAAVAICAMILPGVSGAFLLKAMGIYEVTLGALEGAFALEGAAVVYVLVFLAGAAVGLGSFSKVLNWLIKHYQNATMAALVGLMAGALRALWPWQEADRTLRLPQSGEPLTSVLLLFALGFISIALLTWLSADQLEEETSKRPDGERVHTS